MNKIFSCFLFLLLLTNNNVYAKVMSIDKIKSGKDAPNTINVIIEIASGSSPVKYEFNKDLGILEVDRFIQTPMFYPANYGFIPKTLADDGDPLDVMVITRYPLVPGCLIEVRPIGVIYMEDESGKDEKIIAIPMQKADPYYAKINDISDLPETQVKQLYHFFERYKDLDSGKWVKISGTGNAIESKKVITKFLK